MILAPSLSMAIFFLTREITKNEVLAILSAFLTMISPQFLIGIYAGFYANWFALILAFISSTFMFMFLRTSSFRYAVLFFATLVAVIFTHTYTLYCICSCLNYFSSFLTFFEIFWQEGYNNCHNCDHLIRHRRLDQECNYWV